MSFNFGRLARVVLKCPPLCVTLSMNLPVTNRCEMSYMTRPMNLIALDFQYRIKYLMRYEVSRILHWVNE